MAPDPKDLVSHQIQNDDIVRISKHEDVGDGAVDVDEVPAVVFLIRG